MKVTAMITADNGKVLTDNNGTFGHIIWSNFDAVKNYSEITQEEYDGLKDIADEEKPIEFAEGVELKPNMYYTHNGQKFVYMGEEQVATTWEAVSDKMAEWYD